MHEDLGLFQALRGEERAAFIFACDKNASAYLTVPYRTGQETPSSFFGKGVVCESLKMRDMEWGNQS
jgi:hypothetical protein